MRGAVLHAPRRRAGRRARRPGNPGGDRLPELVELIWNRRIDPGKVFDLALPLEQAAAAYEAMDERRAIKVLLRP